MNILDILNELDTSVCAISGIRDLLANQAHNAQINPENLYFLLDTVIEKQARLSKQLGDSLKSLT